MLADLLQPLFEEIFKAIFYFTARYFLPLLTLGHVTVEPAPRGTRLSFKWHGVHRTANGKVVLDADLATLAGMIFWFVVAFAAIVIYLSS